MPRTKTPRAEQDESPQLCPVCFPNGPIPEDATCVGCQHGTFTITTPAKPQE